MSTGKKMDLGELAKLYRESLEMNQTQFGVHYGYATESAAVSVGRWENSHQRVPADVIVDAVDWYGNMREQKGRGNN